MHRFLSPIVLTLVFAVTLVYAGADIKVKDVPTDSDTTITVKKGSAQECVEFEIIDGKDEITGDGNLSKSAAMQSWKDACKEWKDSMREMNKGNQMISLNCNRASLDKDGDQSVYKSLGSYKMKVRVREKR